MFSTRTDTFLLHFLTFIALILMKPTDSFLWMFVWTSIAITALLLLVIEHTEDKDAEKFPGDMYK